MLEGEGKARGWIAVAIAALILVWGTQYLVIREARHGITAEQAVLVRFVLVAVVGQLAVWLTKARAKPGLWMGRALIGVLQGASMLLLYRAEHLVESAWASMVMALSPLFVVGFATFLVRGDRLGARGLAGLALGFVGAMFLIGPRSAEVGVEGLLMLLGAAASTALAKVFSRKIAPELSPLVMLRDLGVVVSLVVVPFAWGPIGDVGTSTALAHAYLGLIASAGATGAYFWLLRHVAVTRLAFMPFASAAVGVVAGVLAGERVFGSALVGLALVSIGGLVLVYRAQPRRAT